ncbi:thiosulfate ABC transporter substrate-binding protein CysP [Oceanibaculum pacificum]|uniref:Thiosulfate transporter subunit n=1 Tax=Oceanibaculum pacificum TaxID=580166 RepID=A0A154W1J8_9PROT|nr:thiosulfate ABC transporter substrate-binding protein CysP [Oceanibaculum pacificum]KZD07398.1 thiosulfate transporter subunit [Oceanibaculum pacificum]
MTKRLSRLLALPLIAGALTLGSPAKAAEPDAILNVSYDIARELFAAINPLFVADWKHKTGQDIEVKQSHAGSSRQARSILEGLQADVVTFNQVTDVQILHDKGKLVAGDWQQRFPNNASPYYSLPAFLVRKGNPKALKDWDDLVRDGVEVIFPNPKTSGNARYTYMAAYSFAQEKFGGDTAKTEAFVKKLFDNVPVFDTGGRGATTTFIERGIGDVLITFESEVHAMRKQHGEDKYEAITPSVSLLAEFPVAVVDGVAEKRGSQKVAKAYLDFLYAPVAQEVLARDFFYRVQDETVSKKYAAPLPAIRLIKVEDAFGGWDKVTQEHFASGGTLDKLFGQR